MSKLLVAPLEVVTDPELTEPERRVLLVLYSFRGKDTDVIYPGIDSIAARAGYADKTRISKITGTLAKKGWLIKKRRGFTGGNTYKLTVPDSAIEHLAKLDSEAKLEREAKLDQQANSKLDSETNTKLAPEAKNKEQTTEQTIEQTNYGGFDFSSWPELPSNQVWTDYKKFRKRIKADVTQTVITRLGGQLTELARAGWSVDDAIAEQLERGWRGLKSDWLLKQGPPGGPHATHQPNRRESLAERSNRETAEILADIEAREAGDGIVGEDAPTLRTQVGQSGGAGQA